MRRGGVCLRVWRAVRMGVRWPGLACRVRDGTHLTRLEAAARPRNAGAACGACYVFSGLGRGYVSRRRASVAGRRPAAWRRRAARTNNRQREPRRGRGRASTRLARCAHAVHRQTATICSCRCAERHIVPGQTRDRPPPRRPPGFRSRLRSRRGVRPDRGLAVARSRSTYPQRYRHRYRLARLLMRVNRVNRAKTKSEEVEPNEGSQADRPHRSRQDRVRDTDCTVQPCPERAAAGMHAGL